MQKLIEWFVIDVLRARWVVTDGNGEECEDGEFGLRIAGVNLWYYKWPEPMIATSYKWRFAEKREFGVATIKHRYFK